MPSEDHRPTLDDIHAPPALEAESEEPTPQTRLWQEEQQRQIGRLQIRGLTQDLNQRRNYARLLFGILAVWLFCILAILGLEGFGYMGFDLEASVLIAALGTTTGNVIALFVVVARYIFPRNNSGQ
jgi:hypothetical protein